MNDRELQDATVGELASALRTKQVSPRELLDVHIERIRAVEPMLNAVTEDRFLQAAREADAAGHQLRSARSVNELPPLLGVPCTIKEFFAVENMLQTGGLVSLKDHRSVTDATVVRRLREAGAIVMATTNVPEGGMWMETNNLVYGRTNNPWNLGHTPGGSSGGEAALVAAGASPFGIGSDIGGSVRIPAGFCGVAAHKPSGRMVPNTGHWGPKNHGTGPYLTAGPICRSTHDLALLLEIIAGPDGEDTHTTGWAIGDVADVDVSSLTVYEIEDFGYNYSAPMSLARERAIECLVARGATRKTFEVPGVNRPFAVWAAAMEAAADGPGDSFAAAIGKDGVPVSLLKESLLAAIGQARFTTPALAFLALEKLTALVPGSVVADVPRAADLADRVDDVLGGRAVIIHPSYTRAAPKHRAALLTPFDGMTTALWNVLESAVSQVPTGFAPNGLPLGVQVIAARGNDHVAIAAACAIEDDLGRLGRAPVR